MAIRKLPPINKAQQATKLLKTYPRSQVQFNHLELRWWCSLSPTPYSSTYNLKLVYRGNKHPDVYVVSPRLEIYPGEAKLKHVYNSEKQHLCLYYRPVNEWSPSMYIADTIVPWSCEWLYYYEIWSVTGIWHGGGIEH